MAPIAWLPECSKHQLPPDDPQQGQTAGPEGTGRRTFEARRTCPADRSDEAYSPPPAEIISTEP